MEGTLEEPAAKDSSRGSPDRHLKGEHGRPFHGQRRFDAGRGFYFRRPVRIRILRIVDPADFCRPTGLFYVVAMSLCTTGIDIGRYRKLSV